MLNRRSAPLVHQVGNLNLPYPKVLHLDNGIPLYVLDFHDYDVLKVEAVFHAGRPQEEKRLAARVTSKMLREGTTTRTGAEIAEHFDFYGTTMSVPTNLDTANFVLYSLAKYASDVIPVYADLLHNPTFPDAELETFRRTSIQELSVELEKVETQAYRKITELIFGENHPYGYNSVTADYQAIQRADVQYFFSKWYSSGNCRLFVSGKVDDALIQLLNDQFGQKPFAIPSPVIGITETTNPAKPERVDIHHPGSLQSAIKIGRRSFGRKHEDFNGLFVLNTILGGYFGSRLMANIREKKGFTYNIYSTLDAYLNDGCLYIATEVDPGNTEKTVRAIFAEMKKLCDKPVPEDEMEMVRNYLLGMFLNGLDGPMNTADIVRGQIVEELPWESFTTMVETVRNITPVQIQELANKYLQKKDFWVVVVGS